MSEHNKAIQEFLETACSQIRYKSIHKSIINELTDHIEEQKNQYIKEGYNQEEATAKAIEQMGDPVLVGKELDFGVKQGQKTDIIKYQKVSANMLYISQLTF